jgi:hypothetical protein
MRSRNPADQVEVDCRDVYKILRKRALVSLHLEIVLRSQRNRTPFHP